MSISPISGQQNATPTSFEATQQSFAQLHQALATLGTEMAAINDQYRQDGDYAMLRERTTQLEGQFQRYTEQAKQALANSPRR